MVRLPPNVQLAAVLLAATACGPATDQAGGDRDSAAALVRDTTTAFAGSGADEHQAGGPAAGAPATDGSATAGHSPTDHAAAGEGGQPLLPIMQRLGNDMTALTYALMTDDHESVTRSAAAVAEHAPISAEELERIHTLLGSDMAAFEAVDESVHVAAVRLHDAAKARQLGLVVERLGDVQRGCVSCHVQFRERLRTDRGAPR